MTSLSRFLRLSNMPAGEVATTDVEDLSLGYRDIDGLPDLFPGTVSVYVMELIEIDVVGLQPLQAAVQRSADIQCRQLGLVRPLSRLTVGLCCQHRSLAPPTALAEPFAYDRFGRPGSEIAAVDICRVKEVNAVLVRRVHDR